MRNLLSIILHGVISCMYLKLWSIQYCQLILYRIGSWLIYMTPYTGNLVVSWTNIMLPNIGYWTMLLSERYLLYYASFFRLEDCNLFVLYDSPYMLDFVRSRNIKIFEYSVLSNIIVLNIIGLFKMRCTIIILGFKGKSFLLLLFSY